jgi:hypothetical protein
MKSAVGKEIRIEDCLPTRLPNDGRFGLPWIVVVKHSNRQIVFLGRDEKAAAKALRPGTSFGKATSFAAARLMAEQRAALAVSYRLQAVNEQNKRQV